MNAARPNYEDFERTTNPLPGPILKKLLRGGVFAGNDDNAWVPMETRSDTYDILINRKSHFW